MISKDIAQQYTEAAANVVQLSRSSTTVLQYDTAPSNRRHDSSMHRNCWQVHSGAQQQSAAEAVAAASSSYKHVAITVGCIRRTSTAVVSILTQLRILPTRSLRPHHRQ